jgi:tetraacyldisaccharide-1-P 4'-kinase
VCIADAQKCGAVFILVTEKDAVKISRAPGFPLMVAVQGLRMYEETEFRGILRQLIGRRR